MDPNAPMNGKRPKRPASAPPSSDSRAWKNHPLQPFSLGSSHADKKADDQRPIKSAQAETGANHPDSSKMRDAVYDKWLQKKLLEIRRKRKSSRQKQSLEEKKREQERIEKQRLTEANFRAWLERKKKLKALNRKESSKADEHEKLAAKKQEITAAFEAWKAKKKEVTKEIQEKEAIAERQRIEREQEREQDRKEAQIVYEAWKRRSDQEINELARKLSEIKNATDEQNRTIYEEQQRVALDAYNVWLNDKVLDGLRFKRRTKMVLDDRPPWLPPG